MTKTKVKTEQATKREMFAYVKEVAEAYNVNNRSVITSKGKRKVIFHCLYFSKESPGQGCAIGKRIQDKNLAKMLDTRFHSKGIDHVLRKFHTLPEKVKRVFQLPENITRFNPTFLRQIQNLHDSESNWNEKGLSIRGEEYVARLKRCISKGDYCPVLLNPSNGHYSVVQL